MDQKHDNIERCMREELETCPYKRMHHLKYHAEGHHNRGSQRDIP
jgi:hypothetical protein